MKQRPSTLVEKYRVRRGHYQALLDLYLLRIRFRLWWRLYESKPEVIFRYRKCREFLRYNFWNFPEA